MKDYYVFKRACKNVYYTGGGDFWSEIGKDKSIIYTVYSLSILSLFIFVTILEILAVVFGDFPEDEASDAVTFSLSHTIVSCKILSVLLKKDQVKMLSRDMIKLCEKYESETKMASKYKTIKLSVIAFYVTVYGSAVFFVFEGLRKLYYEGTHFVTIVTYYPSFNDNSPPATAFRVFLTIALYIMMAPMIAFDSLAVTFLISLKYKFVTLRDYFDSLQGEFERIVKTSTREAAAENMLKRITEGIVLHQELLRLTKKIDKTFGFLIAIQVFLSFISGVSLLLTLAMSEHMPYTTALKITLFIIGILSLLAVLLCNAGEITIQASLLSESVFYCGWHACMFTRYGRHVGKLVLFTCTIAQKPVVMKGLKMLDFTYGTFLTVVRGMYSVFALINAQQKDSEE